MTKEEKQARNDKIVKIYVDNDYNIDATEKIIEKIPEISKTFAGKNPRRVIMGVLQAVDVWKPLEKKATAKKKDEPTKKELANIFCDCLDITLADIPTFLNVRKIEIARLIESATTIIPDECQPKPEEMETVRKYLEKQEDD